METVNGGHSGLRQDDGREGGAGKKPEAGRGHAGGLTTMDRGMQCDSGRMLQN
jgi:hypothetical protein